MIRIFLIPLFLPLAILLFPISLLQMITGADEDETVSINLIDFCLED